MFAIQLSQETNLCELKDLCEQPSNSSQQHIIGVASTKLLTNLQDIPILHFLPNRTQSHQMLRLSTPNISTTNLVVSRFFLYLIRLTYDSHAVSMILFSFHIMPHALLTISVQCMAMPYFLSSILPPPCGRLMHHFVSIPWPCSMHASTSCYQSPEYSRTVIGRSDTNMYIQQQQYIRAQVPARELQFSSLGFPPHKLHLNTPAQRQSLVSTFRSSIPQCTP